MKAFVILFLSTFLLVGCTNRIPTNKDTLGNEMTKVYNQIQEITKNTYCIENSQCHSIPFGHKACGGPSGHQIFSTHIGSRKIKRLKNLSKRSQELGRQYNKLTMTLSDCMYNDPPKTFCVQNRCDGVKTLF